MCTFAEVQVHPLCVRWASGRKVNPQLGQSYGTSMVYIALKIRTICSLNATLLRAKSSRFFFHISGRNFLSSLCAKEQYPLAFSNIWLSKCEQITLHKSQGRICGIAQLPFRSKILSICLIALKILCSRANFSRFLKKIVFQNWKHFSLNLWASVYRLVSEG